MTFLTPERIRTINPGMTQRLIEDVYGYPHGSLLRKTKSAYIAHPRHLLAYLLVKHGMSTPRVGVFLHEHHTTVLHSVSLEEAKIHSEAVEAAVVATQCGQWPCAGTEDLDDLIRSGGDTPRLTIEQLDKRRA